MSIQEWWAELDSRVKANDRLKKGTGGFTSAEWAEARRKHKAKMNGSG